MNEDMLVLVLFSFPPVSLAVLFGFAGRQLIGAEKGVSFFQGPHSQAFWHWVLVGAVAGVFVEMYVLFHLIFIS